MSEGEKVADDMRAGTNPQGIVERLKECNCGACECKEAADTIESLAAALHTIELLSGRDGPASELEACRQIEATARAAIAAKPAAPDDGGWRCPHCTFETRHTHVGGNVVVEAGTQIIRRIEIPANITPTQPPPGSKEREP